MSKSNPSPIRSFLFAPGNHPRKVEKVFVTGADAVILDLEDAVAISEKEATRSKVIEAMKKNRGCLGYIRVNSLETAFCENDISTVIGTWLDGIVLPKVEDADMLKQVDSMISTAEISKGLEKIPMPIDFEYLKIFLVKFCEVSAFLYSFQKFLLVLQGFSFLILKSFLFDFIVNESAVYV